MCPTLLHRQTVKMAQSYPHWLASLGQAFGRANHGMARAQCPWLPYVHIAPRRSTPARTWRVHHPHPHPCSGTNTQC